MKQSTDPKPVTIVMIKRTPPIWGVKVGARYAKMFSGADAKRSAISFAKATYGPSYSIREKRSGKSGQR